MPVWPPQLPRLRHQQNVVYIDDRRRINLACAEFYHRSRALSASRWLQSTGARNCQKQKQGRTGAQLQERTQDGLDLGGNVPLVCARDFVKVVTARNDHKHGCVAAFSPHMSLATPRPSTTGSGTFQRRDSDARVAITHEPGPVRALELALALVQGPLSRVGHDARARRRCAGGLDQSLGSRRSLRRRACVSCQ